jgi:glycosyltransferase involved in cell wall biosynthesis
MLRPQRIALLGPAYPYRGGIAHFLEHLDDGLSARGHTTRLFTFSRQYPERLFPGKTQLTPREAPIELPLRVLDSVNPFSWTRTATAIRDFGATGVVFNYWMPFFAPAFGRIARSLNRHGIRVVVVVDNAIPHERRPGDVVLARYVLRAANGLVAMSDSVCDDLRDTIGVKVPIRKVVLPVYDNFGSALSKSEARKLLGIPADERLILFFGFVRPYKGLNVLLDAMSHVSRRLPRTRLLVAGECYGDDSQYRRAIQALPEQTVRWDDDYIPDERVAAYFCAADVVVQPYISATQSGVAQIAFNFERPMIVTDVGGLPEVVAHGEAGLVVPPSDAPALADAIVTYFVRGLEDSFAERVGAEKVKFGWDPVYDAIESFL